MTNDLGKKFVSRCMVCGAIEVEGTLYSKGNYPSTEDQYTFSDGILSLQCWTETLPDVNPTDNSKFYKTCRDKNGHRER